MESPQRDDMWARGAAYEPYVGRWSRIVAAEFLAWLARPTGLRWLDVGCGTGALTETVLARAAPAEVVAVEPAEAYREYARSHVVDRRAQFRPGDACALPCQSAHFDVVVAGLVLNFVPEPAAALTEMARAARAGGVVATYVWDYAGEMQLTRYFWNAAAAFDPAAVELDEGRRFPICRPEPLTSLFERAGLARVEVRAIDVSTTFCDFDDYWSPFLGGQGPAPSYVMSLTEDDRAALREHVRADLPTAADGSIHLIARAWAVRGDRSPRG